MAVLGELDAGWRESMIAAGARLVRVAADTFNGQNARLLREEHGRADLIIVSIAACPDIDELMAGIRLFLTWNGTMVLLLREAGAVRALAAVMAQHALRMYDVEKGPSWHVWACHGADVRRTSPRFLRLIGH